MRDQDEIYEAATETPASLGCPSLVPGTVVVHDEPGAETLAELQRKGASLKACNDRSYAKMVRIAELANECVLKTTHAEYAPGQYGQDYRAFGKTMGEIRELVGKSLVERAQKTQSEQQREEARQKRKIGWKLYDTKADICVMGKTQQNSKVYEVRIAKRQTDVSDTYAQCKVNGKTVITCSFTGSAWMLKRILTAGMQALVNYKSKRNRDKRRADKKATEGGEA